MATFRGTYTADEGERPAAGSVTVTSDTGASETATLDADGAYSLVVAGSRFTVAESITGVAARSFEVSARSDGTVDTGRDVGAVLASSLSVSGTPTDGDVVTFDGTAGHAKWAAAGGGGGGAAMVSIRFEMVAPVGWSKPDMHLSFPVDHADGTSDTATAPPILLTAPFTGGNGFGAKFGGYGGDSVPVDTEIDATLLLVNADGETFGQFLWSAVIPAGTDPAAATGLDEFYMPFAEDSSNAVFDLTSPAGSLFVHPPSAGPWTASLIVAAYPA